MSVSFLGGGFFYSAWLAVFLSTYTPDGARWRAALWILAPITTAVGFAVGAAIYERLAGTEETKLARLYAWSLAGCAVGAGAVYWYGPMLIVFTMLIAGTLSIGANDLMTRARTRTGSY